MSKYTCSKIKIPGAYAKMSHFIGFFILNLKTCILTHSRVFFKEHIAQQCDISEHGVRSRGFLDFFGATDGSMWYLNWVLFFQFRSANRAPWRTTACTSSRLSCIWRAEQKKRCKKLASAVVEKIFLVFICVFEVLASQGNGNGLFFYLRLTQYGGACSQNL